MEALVLIGGFLYIGVLGFWIMGKIDRFIDKGGFSHDWDGEETQPAASESNDAALLEHTGNQKDRKIG